MKVILNGFEVDFEAAVELMDDEIREEIHAELSPCTEQEFMNEYVKRHYAKYNDFFEI